MSSQQKPSRRSPNDRDPHHSSSDTSRSAPPSTNSHLEEILSLFPAEQQQELLNQFLQQHIDPNDPLCFLIAQVSASLQRNEAIAHEMYDLNASMKDNMASMEAQSNLMVDELREASNAVRAASNVIEKRTQEMLAATGSVLRELGVEVVEDHFTGGAPQRNTLWTWGIALTLGLAVSVAAIFGVNSFLQSVKRELLNPFETQPKPEQPVKSTQ